MSFSITTSRASVVRKSLNAMGADLAPDGTREWDFAGRCERPIGLALDGRPDQVAVGLGIEPDKPYFGTMLVRCRNCPPCLEDRSRLWAARACSEIETASRTWFGTLTVAPEHRVRALYAAQRPYTSCGHSSWAKLPQDEQFKSIVAQLGPEVGKMLKRVRKNAAARFRYLLVAEAHSDGFPHFHLLLHEQGDACRKAVLDAAWKLGFSKWRLVKGEGKGPAFYVAKYLAKSALARVRASQKYGQMREQLLTERVLGIARALEPLRKAKEKVACPDRGPLYVPGVEGSGLQFNDGV